jgi:hypothetical protein
MIAGQKAFATSFVAPTWDPSVRTGTVIGGRPIGPYKTFVSQNIKDWLGYEPREYLESADFWRRCVHPRSPFLG